MNNNQENQKATIQQWTVANILGVTAKFFSSKGFPSARLDAELLLSKTLNMGRVQLYINFEKILTDVEVKAYRELVRRRGQYEPVAYILEEKEFYGLNFKVNKSVLIPRPETEHLIDEVLNLAATMESENLNICDIGTGSGAIAIALAKNISKAKVSAVDISAEALLLAKENALALEVDVKFYEGNLLEPLKGKKFHFLCANLPYIPAEEMGKLMPDVLNHEPKLALNGGTDGLELIFELLKVAQNYLEDKAYVLLEIWPFTLDSLEEKADILGFTLVNCIRDLAAHPRIAVLKLK